MRVPRSDDLAEWRNRPGARNYAPQKHPLFRESCVASCLSAQDHRGIARQAIACAVIIGVDLGSREQPSGAWQNSQKHQRSIDSKPRALRNSLGVSFVAERSLNNPLSRVMSSLIIARLLYHPFRGFRISLFAVSESCVSRLRKGRTSAAA